MTIERKKTVCQELQLREFKDFTCDDFNYFVGKIKLFSTLKEIYKESSLRAKEQLQGLWRDNLDNPITFNAEYLARIRQCYFELAEADFAWQSCDKHTGRYLGVGVNLSKVVVEIDNLYRFIKNKNNRNKYVKNEE